MHCRVFLAIVAYLRCISHDYSFCQKKIRQNGRVCFAGQNVLAKRVVVKYVRDSLGYFSHFLMPLSRIPFFLRDGPVDDACRAGVRWLYSMSGFFDTKNPRSGHAERHKTGKELFSLGIYKHRGAKNAKTKHVFTTSLFCTLRFAIYKHRLKRASATIYKNYVRAPHARSSKISRFWNGLPRQSR